MPTLSSKFLVLQSRKPILYLDIILFLTSTFFWLFEIKYLHMKLLCYCLLNASLSFTFTANKKLLVLQSAPVKDGHQLCFIAILHPSV